MGLGHLSLKLLTLFVSRFHHLVSPPLHLFISWGSWKRPIERLCDLTKARVISLEKGLAVPAVLAGSCRLLRVPIFPGWQQIVQAARQAGTDWLQTSLIFGGNWKTQLEVGRERGCLWRCTQKIALRGGCWMRAQVCVCASRCACANMCVAELYLG